MSWREGREKRREELVRRDRGCVGMRKVKGRREWEGGGEVEGSGREVERWRVGGRW